MIKPCGEQNYLVGISKVLEKYNKELFHQLACLKALEQQLPLYGVFAESLPIFGLKDLL